MTAEELARVRAVLEKLLASERNVVYTAKAMDLVVRAFGSELEKRFEAPLELIERWEQRVELVGDRLIKNARSRGVVIDGDYYIVVTEDSARQSLRLCPPFPGFENPF